MFHPIQEFALVYADGRVFRPCVYGEPQADGSWAGWVIFFPVPEAVAIAPPTPETTQRTLIALQAWATGLTVVYLEGALERALRVEEQPPVLARFLEAEDQALAVATQLESSARIERIAATVNEAAAEGARAEAEQIRQERLYADRALAALDEQTATANANQHDRAAREARAAASDARQRRRSAEARARSRPRTGRADKKR